MDNKLFVYGIFLDEVNRDSYGMTNPKYDTVIGYITIGHHIVQAIKVGSEDIALTGLVVDVDPVYWDALDRLEHYYDRVRITTTHGVEAWMYVRGGIDGEVSDTSS